MAVSPAPDPQALTLECDWRYAFNLNTKKKGLVGYLGEWRGIGGLTLNKDIVVWSPACGASSPIPSRLHKAGGGTGSGQLIECAGIIEKLEFGGKDSDPIRISVYISKDNQTKLRYKMVKDLTNAKVKHNFAIVGFDEDAKSWYSAIEVSKPPSDAQLNTVKGVQQLTVDFEPTQISETLDINVYRLEYEVIPGTKSTKLKIASGPHHRYISEWKE